MSLIDDFIERYSREYDFYSEVCRLSTQRLDTRLKSTGIRAIVTGRAKNPNRLEAKLHDRIIEKNYETAEDIYKDIVDLAGVRVALYFPSDSVAVGKIIKTEFSEVEPPKEFPKANSTRKHFENYKKRFDGYAATHYRVRLSNLGESQQRYQAAQLEIQVASVLMHAWAEVEHDLIYKPLEGNLSVEELAILDELNGTVLAGEIALERLQRAVESRVAANDSKFSNHYELAAYLYETSKVPSSKISDPDVLMGNVQGLYDLLNLANLNSKRDIDDLRSQMAERVSATNLAGQLIELILQGNTSLNAQYQKLRVKRAGVGLTESVRENFLDAQTIFLRTWNTLECLAQSLNKDSQIPFQSLRALEKRMNSHQHSVYIRVKTTRNNVVHGLELTEPQELKRATDLLNELLESICSGEPELLDSLTDCRARYKPD